MMPKKKKIPKLNLKKQRKNGKKSKRSPWLILLAIVIGLTALSWYLNPAETKPKAEEIAISQLLQSFHSGKYSKLEIEGEEITATLKEKNKTPEKAVKPSNDTLKDLGLTNPPEGTTVTIKSLASYHLWMNIALNILPIILIVGLILFFMGKIGKGMNSHFSFGKSSARKSDRRKKQTKFADVAGCKEAKEDLEEVVDFLKNPKKYQKVGAKIPRGILLVGPPGTGKTLLARAVSGEAGVPFFSIAGSEFEEMFVGVGASRVRDLFGKAKKEAPAIIFIDEIDAVGKQRQHAGGMGGGSTEQTLNQILTEMDGFDNQTNVIILAATNRPDVLDRALLRPGRFDRRVVVEAPNLKAREAILKLHASNKPLAKDINLEEFARMTTGMSGADLENVLNEAAILIAKEDRKKIKMADLSNSLEKVALGRERADMTMKPEVKKKTAYHEAGHAVLAQLMDQADKVHKVTIVSRGMALGVTWTRPEEDQYSISHSKFLDEICVLLGGMAAEELIYGEHETGVANDLEKATNMARKMATMYGMSKDLGAMSFSQADEGDLFSRGKISEVYSEKLDDFVKNTLAECYKKASSTIKKNKDILEKIVARLVDKETINKVEFEKFFAKK